MRSVLASIKPEHCGNIANRKKTVEIRKNCPKIDVPFKCYIYCTKGDNPLVPPHLNCSKYAIHKQNGRKKWKGNYGDSDYKYLNGKVIGEFVCDSIIQIQYNKNGYGLDDAAINGVIAKSCVPENELYHYLQGKTPYLWHISDLKIYDKPKELSEFYKICNNYPACNDCEWCRWSPDAGYECDCYEKKPIKKAPQSWCYVEEMTG